MIKAKLITNDSLNIIQEFNIPTSNSELTLRQYLDIRNAEKTDLLSIISIVTGIDKKDLMNIVESDFNYYINQMTWLNEEQSYEFPLPYKFNYKGVEYNIPNLDKITVGQKLMFQEIRNQAIETYPNLKVNNHDLHHIYSE